MRTAGLPLFTLGETSDVLRQMTISASYTVIHGTFQSASYFAKCHMFFLASRTAATCWANINEKTTLANHRWTQLKSQVVTLPWTGSLAATKWTLSGASDFWTFIITKQRKIDLPTTLPKTSQDFWNLSIEIYWDQNQRVFTALSSQAAPVTSAS